MCACFCLVAVNIGIYMTITWATGPLCKVLPLIGFSDVVLLNRERIAMRDLEPNLSQTLHLVSDHSVLMIFICKQLKKHAAFSAVQRSHETNILLA